MPVAVEGRGRSGSDPFFHEESESVESRSAVALRLSDFFRGIILSAESKDIELGDCWNRRRTE